MDITRDNNKLIFISDGKEYLKIVINSDEITEKIVSPFERYTYTMNHVGEYNLFVSSTEVFQDEPHTTYNYYHDAINHVVCKFTELFCPCDECEDYEFCEGENSEEILCLFNEVYSTILLQPNYSTQVFSFINVLYNEYSKIKIIKSLHKEIYISDDECCENSVADNIFILIFSLYYLYSQNPDYTQEEVDKLFKYEDILNCSKNLGLCTDTLLEALETEFGPKIEPPTFEGFSFTLRQGQDSSIVTKDFTVNDFLSGYTDPQQSPAKSLKIVTLPASGDLVYNGSEIMQVPFEIPVGDIINLSYVKDLSELDTTPSITLGDESLPLSTFRVQMSNQFDYYSNVGDIKAYIIKYRNKRPNQIGNNHLVLGNREIYHFTVADFTTETSPVYSDPENDALKEIKISWMDLPGSLYIINNNSLFNPYVDRRGLIPVVNNQIITAETINSSKFIYVSPNTNNRSQGGFSFAVKDVGSSQFFTDEIHGRFTIESDELTLPEIIAVDDNIVMNFSETPTIPVLDNDTHPEESLVIIVSEPSHGTAYVDENNNIIYVHGHNKEEVDRLQYKIVTPNQESNVAEVVISIVYNAEKLYFGDVDEIPTTSEEVKTLLENDTIGNEGVYSFDNVEKRKNVILIPKTHALDYVITSNQENIKPNFQVRDFTFTNDGGITAIWDMYYHSSVLPLNVTITFKLKLS